MVSLLVGENMQVTGATDGQETFPLDHPVTRLALLENRRVAHRASIPVGAPVVACPTDGEVAMLEDRLGASHDAGWTVECPLCGLKISVGRFATIWALAYFKKRARKAQLNVTTNTNRPTGGEA